jgi:hypothetical protein
METTDFASDFAFFKLTAFFDKLSIAESARPSLVEWYWKESKKWFAKSEAEFAAQAERNIRDRHLTQSIRRGTFRARLFGPRTDLVQDGWVNLLESGDPCSGRNAHIAGIAAARTAGRRRVEQQFTT